MRRLGGIHGTAAGVAVGVGGVALAVALLVPFRDVLVRATPALVLIVPIVLSGLVGGRRPALMTALAAAAGLNLAFIPPYGRLDVHDVDDVVALLVFAFVGLTVGTLVARSAERLASAESRARALDELNLELRTVQQDRERLAEEATKADLLQQVDEQRRALLRSVSHDLRTPLAGIRAVGSDLLTDADYDEATRRELLTIVVDEAERLDRLVANLLSLSRVEAGALQPERKAVALDDVVTEAVRILARAVGDHRVQVEMPSDLPLARGDYTQLQQVVINLLDNAGRHGPPGSMIEVGARERDGMIEVWVDDEGDGIPPFERARIFEPFRAGAGSSSSGIGLAICKAIIEAHDGDIGVDRSPMHGARFQFRVPQA